MLTWLILFFWFFVISKWRTGNWTPPMPSWQGLGIAAAAIIASLITIIVAALLMG